MANLVEERIIYFMIEDEQDFKNVKDYFNFDFNENDELEILGYEFSEFIDNYYPEMIDEVNDILLNDYTSIILLKG